MSKTFKDRKGFDKTRAIERVSKRKSKRTEEDFEITLKGKKRQKMSYANLPYHFDDEL